MNRRQLLKSAPVAACVTASPAVASGQRADENKDIVGSWFTTLAFTNAPVGEVKALFSFHEGGVVTATARYLVKATPLGDLMETSGHGAWARAGHRMFRVVEQLFLQSVQSGAVIGTDELQMSLVTSQDRQTLSGTFALRGKDLSGGIMFEAAGTFSATRIAA
ncbi:MAG: hypothetical protein ACRD7E_01695 [Bryobacteraceae bacterium]